METTLRKLIKEAMIQKKETGNTNRYQTLKNILEKAQKTAKDKKIEALSDELIVDAAKKEIKQLEDVLQYIKEGDSRYAEAMEAISVAKELLPAMASAEDILHFLQNSNTEKNMGTCMKTLKEKFGSSLDGKAASAVVKEYIGQ